MSRRLFCAVFPPEVVRREIHATLDGTPLVPRLRWTRPEKLHLTLAFLGPVERADESAVRAALESAAEAVPAWELELGTLGHFRDRVLFLRVTEGESRLERLATCVRAGLPPAVRDEQPFAPHLTLARPPRSWRPSDRARLERALDPWRWRFRVERVDLVHSRPVERGGTVYSVVHSAALRG